ncbi:MAG: DUF4348 domain-containing protein [Prevotella sp.]|nr:DUF4348 domain-containing protein [Prevotella sp.]
MKLNFGKLSATSAGLLVGLLVLSCLVGTGCTDRKTPPSETVEETDSLPADSLPTDTVEDILEDTPLPKAVDEFFDDFFFNFAGNRNMQFSRIQFPLPVRDGDQTTMLERRQWQYSHFFMSDGYYTLLLDDEQQDSLSKVSSLTHAVVEKLYMHENLVKQYVFDQVEGEWKLTSIVHCELADHPCASFLHFYENFASDTAFQAKSLNDLVLMTVPDSDEDFTDVTGSIMPEQWPTFKPEIIPEGIIYCVNYGQAYTDESQKVLVVRGVANGLSVSMTFRLKNGQWKLVKFST